MQTLILLKKMLEFSPSFFQTWVQLYFFNWEENPNPTYYKFWAELKFTMNLTLKIQPTMNLSFKKNVTNHKFWAKLKFTLSGEIQQNLT